LDKNGNPNYGGEAIDFFALKIKKYFLLAIFSPFLWTLNKVGHSIPLPLDLDGHNMKWH